MPLFTVDNTRYALVFHNTDSGLTCYTGQLSCDWRSHCDGFLSLGTCKLGKV